MRSMANRTPRRRCEGGPDQGNAIGSVFRKRRDQGNPVGTATADRSSGRSARGGRSPLLAGLDLDVSGGSERLVRFRHRAPRSDVPRGAPSSEDVRDRVVLHGRCRQGRRGPIPFPILQSLFDGLYPPGLQWYWKADFFREISDQAVDLHMKHGEASPARIPPCTSTRSTTPPTAWPRKMPPGASGRPTSRR